MNNKANARRVILDTADRGRDLLFCEDDIDLAPDFPAALMAAMRTGQTVTFWLHKAQNHPALVRDLVENGGNGVRPGFYRVVDQPHWFGTQCVYLPAKMVRRCARMPTLHHDSGEPFDSWVRHHIPNLRVALPNPVQHRSPPDLVTGGKRSTRVSPTFHVHRLGSWEEANVV